MGEPIVPVGHRRQTVAAVEEGEFFPGQAAHILGLEHLSYRQLSRLFEVATYSDRPRPKGWLRCTFRDLVAMRTAFQLAEGAVVTQSTNRRLSYRLVVRVCRHLIAAHQIDDPLVKVRMVRVEGRILVTHRGIAFEPLSGQTVIASFEQGLAEYGSNPDKGPMRNPGDLARSLLAELPAATQVPTPPGFVDPFGMATGKTSP